jgi:bleomycin hydrolase
MRCSMTCSLLAVALTLLLAAPAAGARQASPELKQVLKMSDAQKAKLPPATKQLAVATFGLRAVAQSNDFLAKHDPKYDCLVPGEDQPHRIRDQKGSGRCWIYATDRVLRSVALKRGVTAPEMSTSYVNYFALRDQVMGVLNKAAAGDKKGLKPFLVRDAASEGGYQPWALDIIREHGFVPKRAMGSSADAFASGVAINELQRLLAAAQGEFRVVKKDAPDAATRRQAILQRYEGELDGLLSATLGKPPAEFTYQGKRYTPQSFLSDYLRVGSADLDLVVLSHSPTHGFMRRRTVSQAGMKPFAEYNVSMPVIEKAVQDAIRAGQAVYVATNVSSDNPYRVEAKTTDAKGVLSLAAFKYGSFIPQHPLDKHDRMQAGISRANHAMVITGFDVEGRGVRKWLIDNSWGPKAGAGGHWHMYDDYFREYVEEVAVPRSLVPADILARCDARAKKPMK